MNKQSIIILNRCTWVIIHLINEEKIIPDSMLRAIVNDLNWVRDQLETAEAEKR